MKRNKYSQKEITSSLIKDYLINFKLIGGLNAIGINVYTYENNLGETILKVMGFEKKPQNEKINETLFELSEKVIAIDIKNQPKELEALVIEIYTWLKSERRKKEK